MKNIRFLKDFGNIMDWVQQEHLNCQDGTEQIIAYRDALVPMHQLNEKLINFFWDANTLSYRYPTEQEINDDAEKWKLYENLHLYYEDIVEAADTYFNYVNKWNQENQKKREVWEKWKKESKQGKKTEEPEKPGEDIRIPAQYYMLYNYAKQGLWEFQDAMKEEHPLAAKSELLANLRKAPDAPTDMQELNAMNSKLEELIQQEQEISKDDNSLDEPIVTEEKKEVIEGQDDYLKELTEEEKKELENEAKQKQAKQAEDAKLLKEGQERAKALAEQEAKIREEARKAREEEYKKEQEAIKENSDKAQEALNGEVEQLLKQMKEANKGLFHINSKEFKAMRNSLYDLAKFTKQIREKNKTGENNILDQKTKEDLQKKINNLEEATEFYISEKGMGQQKTTRGKKRINLAYNISNFLMKMKENSRERYRMLEEKEIKRLEWEEKNADKIQAMKEENEKLEGFNKISSLYGRSLYEFSKLEGLENLPENTLFQKKFKEDYQKLQELMRNSADIRLVNAARANLSTSKFLMMREDEFEDLDEDVKKSVTKMRLDTPKWERAEKGDISKFRNNPEFFKERLKEYLPLIERLGDVENIPYELKFFVQEYKGLIDKTEEKDFKPEYMMVQMRHLRDAALFTLPDLIKKNDISLPEKENQEEISNKNLYKLLYHSLSKEFDVMREQFLGYSRKEIEEALSPQFFVADFYRKYGNFLDQLCEQSPEVKEAWEWVNEEMNSPDTNANKIAGFMNRKLYKALTSDNIKKYEISLEGVEPEEVYSVIGKMRSTISKNSEYLLTSYSVGGRAVKRREDRKNIEQQLENVKKAYGEENHATAFYEKLSKAILAMNDGSGAYTSILNRQTQLHDYLVKGLDINRKEIVGALSNVQKSLEDLATSKDVKDPERIQEVLLNITKECKEEKEFSQKEQERIAEEIRIAKEREIEEANNQRYEHRDLRQLVKDNFPKLKEQGIFKDYEKEANVFEQSLLKFKDDRKILLPMFKQFNMALGALAGSQLETASKDVLMKISGQLEKEIQGIQSHKVKEAWDNYFSANKKNLEGYSTALGMNKISQKKRREDYAHRLVALEALGIDNSFLESVENTHLDGSGEQLTSEKETWKKLLDSRNLSDSMNCIAAYMRGTGTKEEDLIPEFKVMKRLQDNKKIVFDLKSVDKLLKNETITSEDLIHDKILLEMAKFSDKMLKKIAKYGNEQKEFIRDSVDGIHEMLDEYEKFLKDKYQNKELSFYKENPAHKLNNASKDLDRENPTGELYKEWKELQLAHRKEQKHQGIIPGKDKVKAAGVMGKLEIERYNLRYKYSGEEKHKLEDKYLLAKKLNIPTCDFHSLETEIKYQEIENARYEKAMSMYEEMERDSSVDKHMLRNFKSFIVNYSTKANLSAYYLMKEAKGKEGAPSLKEVGDFLHEKKYSVTKNEDISYAYERVAKYCQYQKAFVDKERREDIYDTAGYLCRGMKHFERPIEADKYACKALLDAVMDQENLTDSFAMHLQETIDTDKSIAKIVKMPDAAKVILKAQKIVKEGSIPNLKLLDALRERSVATIEDCKEAYCNITKAQLGMEILKKLNEMTPQKRKEYLDNGGAKKILDRFEKLDQFLDSKMPTFLKEGDSKVQNRTIMNQTLLLLSEDRLKEFVAKEKEMEEAQKTAETQKTDSVKEENETEMGTEL